MLKNVYQQDFNTYKQNMTRYILTTEIKSKPYMIDDNLKIDIIIPHIISPVIVNYF